MLDPTVIVAIIGLASVVYTSTVKVVSDLIGKCNNEDKPDENALSVQSVTAVSSPNGVGLNETLQFLYRRMDRPQMKLKSLQKRIKTIRAEWLKVDKRADEAISTYGYDVHVIMLFHGLGSIFLQVNYPKLGTSVSVLMVVSFFSSFMVSYIVNFYKIEKISHLGNDLQRQQRELQNEISDFGAEIESTYTDGELKTFASFDRLGEVLKWIDSLNTGVGALQSDVTGIRDLSSYSESNRMRSLSWVTVCAILYGLIFSMMAYYLLYFVKFRRMGFIY